MMLCLETPVLDVGGSVTTPKTVLHPKEKPSLAKVLAKVSARAPTHLREKEDQDSVITAANPDIPKPTAGSSTREPAKAVVRKLMESTRKKVENRPTLVLWA